VPVDCLHPFVAKYVNNLGTSGPTATLGNGDQCFAAANPNLRQMDIGYEQFKCVGVDLCAWWLCLNCGSPNCLTCQPKLSVIILGAWPLSSSTLISYRI